MTIEEIIQLVKDCEEDKDISFGYHLHARIGQAIGQRWGSVKNYEGKFSDFLIDLKEAEPRET